MRALQVAILSALVTAGAGVGCNPKSPAPGPSKGPSEGPPRNSTQARVAPSAARVAPPPAAPSTDPEGHGPPPEPLAAPTPATAPPPASPDTSPYAWHGHPAARALTAVDDLEARFAPPGGFARVPLEPASFGAWLRKLPLAAPGTPVRAYDERLLLDGRHRHVAAVATLDTGTADLQQCADAVMRLHAEWKWSRADHDVSYRSANGLLLPYLRWKGGERLVIKGASLEWAPGSQPSHDYGSFRQFLDAVFNWTNTVALAGQGERVAFENVMPGDFFVLPGAPGHAVLILDLAASPNGARRVLLGQSYMPAQSFHVLQPTPGEPWFSLDERSPGVQTPFWPALFPWDSVRRLR